MIGAMKDNFAAFSQPHTSTEFRSAVLGLLRITWLPGLAPLLSSLLSSIIVADLADDADFILWDRPSRVLCVGESSFLAAVVNNRQTCYRSGLNFRRPNWPKCA